MNTKLGNTEVSVIPAVISTHNKTENVFFRHSMDGKLHYLENPGSAVRDSDAELMYKKKMPLETWSVGQEAPVLEIAAHVPSPNYVRTYFEAVEQIYNYFEMKENQPLLKKVENKKCLVFEVTAKIITLYIPK